MTVRNCVCCIKSHTHSISAGHSVKSPLMSVEHFSKKTICALNVCHPRLTWQKTANSMPSVLNVRATGTTQHFTLDPRLGSGRLALLLSMAGRRMELYRSLRSTTNARKSVVGNSQTAPARKYASSKCFQPATEEKQ